MKVTTTSRYEIDIYLLLFFFGVYNSLWLNDLLGRYYHNWMFLLCTLVYVLVTRQWNRVASYYSLARICGRVLPFFFMVMGAIILYRLAQFFVFRMEIRPEMVAVVRANGPVFVAPLLEDLFFIGVVFQAIRQHMRCGVSWSLPSASRGEILVHRKGRSSPACFWIPFLVTFYWFLLPHQYSNHFLDPTYTFLERIRDFPSDILIGLLCGVMVFMRSHSLILAGIVHYTYDILVWGWVQYFWPAPP
jgi:hypothetical protein